ncbi:NACHT domain-containing protein [Vibrio neptunius]|uniref:NACHT domain-containing protein n=1 Tax=Vibrio neptunius TaxID=170651 RepID=UPI00331502AF
MTGMETSIIGLASTPLGKKVTKAIFSKSVSYSASFITSFKKQNEENKLITRYLEACEGIKKFRTIGFSSKDVSFDDIYVPLNITSSTNANYVVNDSLELRHKRPINIVGRAGQGKSTILRRLFLNMVNSGTKLPFFFELKYFKEESLEENLIKEFKKWGFTFDKNTVLEFISRRDVTLFLDAFDEVPTVRVNDVLEQITRIKNTSMCNIIITSRPNTRICFVENIDTFDVVDLTQEQVMEILEVICPSRKQFDSLKLAISNKAHVLEAMVSPILVVLLQIVYSHSNAVPHTLNDFYNRVFLTLFHRHDELKTNVERGFKTDLTCDQSEKVFQAFCYLSLKSNDLSFTKEKALQHMEHALKLRGFGELKPSDFFHDIFHVTNIIQEDGYDNYSFFHRSLQEFYSYKFIKGYLDSDQQKKFFSQCLNSFSFESQFMLVLNFFHDDPEATSYLDNYFLPLYGEILGSDNDFDYRTAGEKLARECTYKAYSSFSNGRQKTVSGVGLPFAPRAIRKLVELQQNTLEHHKETELKNILHSLQVSLIWSEKNKPRLFDELAELPGSQLFVDGKGNTKFIDLNGDTVFGQLMTDAQRDAYLDAYCNLIERTGLREMYKKKLQVSHELKENAARILFDDL